MKLFRNALLETFVTVVECGGFTDAQYALGITQSAISIRIRDLEDSLGYRVCERGRGGFRLTERGEIAYHKAREILRNVRDFDAELLELRNAVTGDLRIGIVDAVNTLTDLHLAKTLKRFLDRPNEVRLEIVVASPTELTQRLISGDLHVAISPFRNQVAELRYTKLCDEEHRLYCGRNHPLFAVPDTEISLKDLAKYEICQRSYDVFVSPEVKATDMRAVVANMEAMAILIETGHYLGALPVHFATSLEYHNKLRAVAPDRLNWSSTFYIATRSNYLHRRAVELFVADVIQSSEVRAKSKKVKSNNGIKQF